MTDARAGAAAVILAGGRSTRLGRDKASELLLGRTLLQRAVERVAPLVSGTVVVRAEGQALPSLDRDVTVAGDVYPGTGPLGGIYSGLIATDAGRCLVVACDMPLLSAPLIAHLLSLAAAHDVVMPVLSYPEPLHAVYVRACVEPVRRAIEAGRLKITNFLGEVDVRYVKEDECRAFDPELRSFMNANTEEALAAVRAILGAEEGPGAAPAG